MLGAIPPLPRYALVAWCSVEAQGQLYFAFTLAYSSLNVRDQVSHPSKTTGKIMALYILIFKFLDRRREDKNILKRMVASILQIEVTLNLFVDAILT